MAHWPPLCTDVSTTTRRVFFLLLVRCTSIFPGKMERDTSPLTLALFDLLKLNEKYKKTLDNWWQWRTSHFVFVLWCRRRRTLTCLDAHDVVTLFMAVTKAILSPFELLKLIYQEGPPYFIWEGNKKRRGSLIIIFVVVFFCDTFVPMFLSLLRLVKIYASLITWPFRILSSCCCLGWQSGCWLRLLSAFLWGRLDLFLLSQ